jgi:hypothetical protein
MSFLTDYVRYCGTSEVPVVYHQWAGLLCLASAASDHVWLEKHHGERLVPNLYVFLLGPSGIGKGVAISLAFRLLQAVPAIRVLRGKITAAYLADFLAAKKGLPGTAAAVRKDAKVTIVTPELALAVGRGGLADDLIKLLTELYTGGDYEFHEGTRTHGTVTFRNHCLNWIAGTTREWLRDCVTKDAVEGGFFARVAPVQAAYDLSTRIPVPSVPTDWQDVRRRLVAHLDAIASTNGELALTRDAQRVLDDWYLHRPEPDDEAMIPTWKREHDLVLKLSMLLALADDPRTAVVGVHHAIGAQRLAAKSALALPALVEYVALTRETEGLRLVREAVRRAGTLPHVALARSMSQVGMTGDKLKLFIDTLVESGWIRSTTVAKTLRTYVWTGRRVLPAVEEESDDC